jgi:hypothetical protein
MYISHSYFGVLTGELFAFSGGHYSDNKEGEPGLQNHLAITYRRWSARQCVTVAQKLFGHLINVFNLVRADLVNTPGTPQCKVWNYLWKFVSQADLVVCHPVEAFVPKNVKCCMSMPATTDGLLDGLNKPLRVDDIAYYQSLFVGFTRMNVAWNTIEFEGNCVLRRSFPTSIEPNQF